VNRAKDAGQDFPGAGILFKSYQISIELIEVLIALDKEILTMSSMSPIGQKLLVAQR
jgi:hypothetical protein